MSINSWADVPDDLWPRVHRVLWEARFQEHLELAAFVTNALYIMMTIPEEVSLIRQQKWGFAKFLFKFVRYCTPIYALLYMIRTFPNHLTIPPEACKALFVITTGMVFSIPLLCDLTIGLCISALLGANVFVFVFIMLLAGVLSAIALILNFVAIIEFPAETVPWVDEYFGNPCYFATFTQLNAISPVGWKLEKRAYAHMATTLAMFVLAVASAFVRYRHNQGQLIKVIRRDGGLYILIVTIFRFVKALMSTNAIMESSKWKGWPLNLILDTFQTAIYPILVQQLLINMRMIDYAGTKPIASTLLFARPEPGTEDSELDEYSQDTETSYQDSEMRRRDVDPVAAEPAKQQQAGTSSQAAAAV